MALSRSQFIPSTQQHTLLPCPGPHGALRTDWAGWPCPAFVSFALRSLQAGAAPTRCTGALFLSLLPNALTCGPGLGLRLGAPPSLRHNHAAAARSLFLPVLSCKKQGRDMCRPGGSRHGQHRHHPQLPAEPMPCELQRRRRAPVGGTRPEEIGWCRCELAGWRAAGVGTGWVKVQRGDGSRIRRSRGGCREASRLSSESRVGRGSREESVGRKGGSGRGGLQDKDITGQITAPTDLFMHRGGEGRGGWAAAAAASPALAARLSRGWCGGWRGGRRRPVLA